MREIKFRVWDTVNNSWYTEEFYVQDSKVFILDDDGGCDDPECCGGASYNMYHQEHLIPVEYTGLKDKNGKEIFEGDVVNVKSIEKTQTVEFLNGCFDIHTYGNDDWERLREYAFTHEIEVIGNIYENTELLKNDNGTN